MGPVAHLQEADYAGGGEKQGQAVRVPGQEKDVVDLPGVEDKQRDGAGEGGAAKVVERAPVALRKKNQGKETERAEESADVQLRLGQGIEERVPQPRKQKGASIPKRVCPQ